MAYFNYMKKIAVILGAAHETVDQNMGEVLEFEIQLANVSLV